MRMRIVKNILAFLGFVFTMYCSITSYGKMASEYVLYLVAIWLGAPHNDEP